jgi:hypothetical protein
MRKRSLILLFFSTISTLTFSQVKWNVWYPTPIVGYVWQKTHNLEVGATFNLTNSGGHRHMMIGIPMGLDLYWIHKTNYVSPFISMKYYCSFSKKLNGADISLIYSISKINNVVDHRLIPEIGLVLFAYVRISYGYSISVGSEELSNIGRHRISIRLPGI